MCVFVCLNCQLGTVGRLEQARKLMDSNQSEQALTMLSRAVYPDPNNPELFRVRSRFALA